MCYLRKDVLNPILPSVCVCVCEYVPFPIHFLVFGSPLRKNECQELKEDGRNGNGNGNRWKMK